VREEDVREKGARGYRVHHQEPAAGATTPRGTVVFVYTVRPDIGHYPWELFVARQDAR
jgi:hypothetical protein